MAMTTRSSTNVNPFWFERTENLCLTIRTIPYEKRMTKMTYASISMNDEISIKTIEKWTDNTVPIP